MIVCYPVWGHFGIFHNYWATLFNCNMFNQVQANFHIWKYIHIFCYIKFCHNRRYGFFALSSAHLANSFFLLLLFSILCYFFMTSIKYLFIYNIENHPLLPLYFLSKTLATWPCLQYILATVILLLHFVLHFYNFNVHTIIHCLMNIK